MAARLKVFVTSDGLTDYVVAASSRPKALAAWGVRQDLFKEGIARETDDPALVAAATAQPGEVLRRPAGTRETLAKAKATKKAKPAGPSKAALRKVAAAEARLAEVQARRDRTVQDLHRERAELEARVERETAAAEAQVSKAQAALAEARRALTAG